MKPEYVLCGMVGYVAGAVTQAMLGYFRKRYSAAGEERAP